MKKLVSLIFFIVSFTNSSFAADCDQACIAETLASLKKLVSAQQVEIASLRQQSSAQPKFSVVLPKLGQNCSHTCRIQADVVEGASDGVCITALPAEGNLRGGRLGCEKTDVPRCLCYQE